MKDMLRRRTVLGLLGGALAPCPVWGVSSERGNAQGLVLRPPTEGQPILDGSRRKGVFMDTGTGRPESGMFGNVRKYADGSPRFHEGIDIAPAQPWRRDRNPTDRVCAAADGLVVYVNRCERNPSLYGNYVVLTHEVAGFGEAYTLYAHLRTFAEGLRAGQRVRAGHVLGIMGHTPDFPLARAHLHFEIGVMMNRHYPLIDDQHGVWNGANLYGIDPCDAFGEQRRNGFFDLANYLKTRPYALSVVLPKETPVPEFFRRHPSLMCGRPVGDAPLEVAFSREGIPVACGAFPLTGGRFKVNVWAKELVRGRPFATVGKVGEARLTARGEALLENLLVSPSRLPGEAVVQGEVG